MMATSSLPNDLVQLIELAGIIVFSTTTIAAILSSIVIKKDDLLYLGSQIVLLCFFLYHAQAWAFPLWFTNVFANPDQYVRIVLTLLFLALAFTIDVAIKVLVWKPVVRRSGIAAVPPLLVGTVGVLVYLFIGLVIVQFVYGQSITALATLSGAFAIVLGLSAQTTLGEMFAGIAIALSRPFRIGDWIKIGQHDEGRVVDMTWRLVRIETRDKNVINIPNRMAADSPVRNYSYPNHATRITEQVYFAPRSDVAGIQALLVEAMGKAKGVLADPRPSALYRGVRDGVAEYDLRFFIDDYAERTKITENVWRSVVERVAGSDFALESKRTTVSIEGLPAELTALKPPQVSRA